MFERILNQILMGLGSDFPIDSFFIYIAKAPIKPAFSIA
jgi:hypothetical protein